MTYSTFELKYCERCGGLGVRSDKSGLPYCDDCEQMMQRFLATPPSRRAASGRLRRAVFHAGERVFSKSGAGIGKREAVYAC
jgi:hypothetical protein